MRKLMAVLTFIIVLTVAQVALANPHGTIELIATSNGEGLIEGLFHHHNIPEGSAWNKYYYVLFVNGQPAWRRFWPFNFWLNHAPGMYGLQELQIRVYEHIGFYNGEPEIMRSNKVHLDFFLPAHRRLIPMIRTGLSLGLSNISQTALIVLPTALLLLSFTLSVILLPRLLKLLSRS